VDCERRRCVSFRGRKIVRIEIAIAGAFGIRDQMLRIGRSGGKVVAPGAMPAPLAGHVHPSLVFYNIRKMAPINNSRTLDLPNEGSGTTMSANAHRAGGK
jgi:hypothetical protein